MKHNDKAPLIEPDPSTRPGARLCAARKANNLSQENVAERLNLSLDWVKAMEDEDYSRLPGETFARGYMRAYARLVGIEENDVIPREPIPDERILSADRFRTKRKQILRSHSMHQHKTSSGKYWVAALLAVIILSWGFAGIPWSQVFKNLPVLTSLRSSEVEHAREIENQEPEVKIKINRSTE